MKRRLFNILIAILALTFAACEKDIEIEPIVFTDESLTVTPSYHSAKLVWEVTTEATIDMVILECATDSAFKEKVLVGGELGGLMTKLEGENHSEQRQAVHYKFEKEVEINAKTTYYIHFQAGNSVSWLTSKVYSFKSKDESAPEVRTDSIVNITTSSADVYGTLVDWGSDTKPTQIGFCYGTHSKVTVEDEVVLMDVKELKDSVISCALTNLISEEKYYVRAFAQNSYGIAYGEEKSFTAAPCTVPVFGETVITCSDYTVGCFMVHLVSDGGVTPTEFGGCCSTSPNPTIADMMATDVSYQIDETGWFYFNFQDLEDGTKYYVRAYAINHVGIAYSENIEYTTLEYALPNVTTSNVTDISFTTATCGGKTTNKEGDLPILERGICCSTSPEPTIADKHIVATGETDDFTVQITGLEENTTYYVRAYATNNKGVGYGEAVSFTTKESKLPVVSTTRAAAISETKAACYGSIPDDGEQMVTERGVCYSEDSNPTIDDNKIVEGSGAGEFVCYIDNLTANTTYYVRAYATNNKGTAYGEVLEVTTLSEGMLPGEFSVSATKKVRFSKGNLQFNAASGSHACSDGTTQAGTWRFAENQYDYIGEANLNASASYNGWIDAFGWGTSGYNEKYPYMSTNDAGSYGNGSDDIAGTKYDWGVYNSISNGENTPNLWRTLTNNEWTYLKEHYTNSGILCITAATINGEIHGLVLLPDDFVIPSGLGVLDQRNITKWTDNFYSLEEWKQMEAAGAVFLPAAGYKDQSNYNFTEYDSEGKQGRYWTSTSYSSAKSYYLFFEFRSNNGVRDELYFWNQYDDSYNHYPGFNRYNAYSVRLVQDVK